MTNTQRLAALLAALRGSSVKAATVTRVANAFADAYRPNETLSPDQAAALALHVAAGYVREIVVATERRAAEQAALANLIPFDLDADP